jgi:hypothetical protein
MLKIQREGWERVTGTLDLNDRVFCKMLEWIVVLEGVGAPFIVSPTNLVVTMSESRTSPIKDGLVCKEINNAWNQLVLD